MRISDWSSDVCSSDLLIPGLRKINQKEAEIVRTVFARYQAGESLRRISAWLNELEVPSPRGSKWQPSAFIGTVARQTGILRNTLYKGLVTFDRMAYRKHPETGRSEEHTSELQSLMRISYAVFCLKKKIKKEKQHTTHNDSQKSK